MNRRSISISAALAALMLGLASPSWAAYPDRPVRLIVPFAPGGGTDIVGRQVAERLTTMLKQPFVVENKPGAGAMLGADYVAQAAPDGYTLLMGTSAELTIGPRLTPSIARYDPVKDFAPVALIGVSPNVLVAASGFAPKTIPEIISYGKANPDRLSYGSGGTGTGPHLAGELLKSMGKLPMTHIPYKGSGPALTDVLAGQTQLMMSTVAPALPFIKSGKLHAIAVTSGKRSPLLPNVPTVAEQGLAGYEAVTWYAVVAPAGVPAEVQERLRNAIAQILQSKEFIDKLAALGVETPEASASAGSLKERIRRELDQWGTVIRDAGIRAE
ncbi:tripartite tricarboxylate transporter substrate binding protein [Variovorax sp. Sphag1AA]|uniref:Bug family tripartite tricarboxylate transporter substrate binding protein n=1 Tax=Variovorax sp. Sphag1AA TaxID=2587027 RepID=UPI00161B6609|nr:tripartite tricarboxylate transporter substrate binding protein [Variovorax sp. Sphag1AA]MBB3182000.1 tripartite-type tricarboxylate transporter receptor subunit TctC [Variovorax sp. Sphag1AA]